MVSAVFEFFADNPPSIAIAGGILMLLLSPAYEIFGTWGWIVLGIGVVLQVLWIFFG